VLESTPQGLVHFASLWRSVRRCLKKLNFKERKNNCEEKNKEYDLVRSEIIKAQIRSERIIRVFNWLFSEENGENHGNEEIMKNKNEINPIDDNLLTSLLNTPLSKRLLIGSDRCENETLMKVLRGCYLHVFLIIGFNKNL
jgi:hypothetical protein